MEDSKKMKIYAKCNGRCAYCGKKIDFDDLTQDHVVPKAKGGPNAIDNLLPCCEQCNKAKGNMSLEQFRKFVGSIPCRLGAERDFQMAKRYGLLKTSRIFTNEKVVFFFETIGTCEKKEEQKTKKKEKSKKQKNTSRSLATA